MGESKKITLPADTLALAEELAKRDGRDVSDWLEALIVKEADRAYPTDPDEQSRRIDFWREKSRQHPIENPLASIRRQTKK